MVNELHVLPTRVTDCNTGSQRKEQRAGAIVSLNKESKTFLMSPEAFILVRQGRICAEETSGFNPTKGICSCYKSITRMHTNTPKINQNKRKPPKYNPHLFSWPSPCSY